MELAAVHVHAPQGRELAYLRGNGSQRTLSNVPAAVEAWHSVLRLGVLNKNASDAVCMHGPGCDVFATTHLTATAAASGCQSLGAVFAAG
jgi:hypothetical protein